VIWSSLHTPSENVDSSVTGPDPKEHSSRLSPLFENLLNLHPMLTKQEPLWLLFAFVARVTLHCHCGILSFGMFTHGYYCALSASRTNFSSSETTRPNSSVNAEG